MKRLKKLIITILGIFGCMSVIPLTGCASEHTITMINENPEMGTIMGEGKYKSGRDVTISYTANKGYRFDGWLIDGQEVKSSNKSYTFKMPEKDIVIKGFFDAKTYKLSLSQNDPNCKITGEGTYKYNSDVTITCTPGKGYEFYAWGDKNNNYNIVSNNSTYTFKMPAKDLSYRAGIIKSKYQLTIVVSDPNVVTASFLPAIEDFYYNETYHLYLDFHYISGKHYGLKGIYEYENGQKGKLISTTQDFVMPNRDYTIYVEVDLDYEVAIKGSKEYSNNKVYFFPNTYVTLHPYDTKVGEFVGWYDGKNNLLSSEPTYTFKTTNEAMEVNGRYNVTFTDLVEFGSYPQTLVTDKDLMYELDQITELNSNGYIEYEGHQYFKTSSKDRYISNVEIPSGLERYSDINDRYHYFKVEPIKWHKIHTFENTDLSILLSDCVLNFRDITSEDMVDGRFLFKTSTVSQYLNETFFNEAFSEEEQRVIQEETVELQNSYRVESLGFYISESFTSKVFLPAHNDLYGINLPDAYQNDPLYFVSSFGKVTDYVYFEGNIKHSKFNNEPRVNNTFYVTDFLVREHIQDTYQLIADGSRSSYTSPSMIKVGETYFLKPMIFVKGL